MATDDLLGLMNELRVDRAHLVGLSNGARIAIDFAILQPSRVRSLVLASPGVSGWVGSDPMTWMAPVIAAARAGELERAADLWAETPLMQIPSDSAAASRVRALSRDNRAIWGYRSSTERQLNPPAIGRLTEIRAPTLIVSGDRDLPDLRRLADSLARGIAGARLHVIRRAGHMLNVSAPAEFNDVMSRFLR